MISENEIPMWFIFIQLHPAMKELSNKTLVSSQFKAISESNPLPSSIVLILSWFQEKCLELHKLFFCLGAGAGLEVRRLPMQYMKDKAAENDIHKD